MKSQTKKILGIHVGLTLAELICTSAFIVELRRAIGGNDLSWAYVVEWPILGLYGVYVWRKLLIEELDERHGSTENPVEDVGVEASRAAFNAYLARVHEPRPANESHDPHEKPESP
ncbi:MAG: hypothetical protein KGJ10_02885 [Acidobacteriota bacterium]|nr:hypothetical protein [Acidobacteriota bacterium]MDE3043758.1 hypothetical protein [Acidobacteriota bacterium]MDE3107223.1 hypothetical protein [Acidobacteriota bacterium]MDE3222506.1 hypothetical protein [Acidobacteriota bacterium]